MSAGTMTSSWDAATKHGAVKDNKGVETSFVWTEKTTVAGTAKVARAGYVDPSNRDFDRIGTSTGRYPDAPA